MKLTYDQLGDSLSVSWILFWTMTLRRSSFELTVKQLYGGLVYALLFFFEVQIKHETEF